MIICETQSANKADFVNAVAVNIAVHAWNSRDAKCQLTAATAGG